MAYSYQTFSVGEVLTAAKMQQVEVNIRDHQHGVSGVAVTNAETVDSIHASASPEANKLLALSGSADYPNSVIPNAVLTDGTRPITGAIDLAPASRFRLVGGYSGGQLQMEKPASGTNLADDIAIDIYTDRFRVFEGAGNARGFYVDLTGCGTNASTKIWHDGNYGGGALVYNTAGAAAGVAIPFTSEAYDTNNIHDNVTNNTRLTVPSGVTKVRLSGQVLVATSTAAYAVQIIKNGVNSIGQAYVTERPAASSDTCQSMLATAPMLVSAGDYFTINTLGQAASAQTTGYYTWFAMEILG